MVRIDYPRFIISDSPHMVRDDIEFTSRVACGGLMHEWYLSLSLVGGSECVWGYWEPVIELRAWNVRILRLT